MQTRFKIMFAAAAATLMGAGLATPLQAQPIVPWYDGGPYYSIYQSPDGTYDSPGDFIRDLTGVPCGMTCTREAQERWARYYGQPYPYHRHYGYDW